MKVAEMVHNETSEGAKAARGEREGDTTPPVGSCGGTEVAVGELVQK